MGKGSGLLQVNSGQEIFDKCWTDPCAGWVGDKLESRQASRPNARKQNFAITFDPQVRLRDGYGLAFGQRGCPVSLHSRNVYVPDVILSQRSRRQASEVRFEL